MKSQQKYRALKRLIPSISELEFVFFVSLLLSSSAVSMVRLYVQNREFFVSLPGFYLYQVVGVLLMYGGTFSWMAYRAIKRPTPSTKKVDRARMVLIPAYFMVIFTLGNQVYQELIDQQVSLGLLAQVVSSIILIRSGALILLVAFFKDNKFLHNHLGELLDTYQINQKESIWVIILGIAASSIVVLSSNWLLSIVVVYSVGELCLKYYRSLRTV